ncbi:MAG: hypothetical protein K2J35_07570 [Eubacterium sp.]|nr:hypothetical protein [Eubacterium sp.]
MFEQDYIMRIIKSMIGALLKLLFDIDTDSPTAELIEDYDARNNLIILTDMIDDGDINHAENELHRLLSENMLDLKAGILFYSYLNDKEDEFLEQHDFSRDEVELGIRALASKYEIDDILGLF